MAKVIRTTAEFLRRGLSWALAGILGLIILLVFAQVVARYITHSGTHQIAEICRISLIWLVFIGGAVLVSERKLIVIDFIASKVGDRGLRKLGFFVDVVTAVFAVSLAVCAWQLIGIVSIKIAPATGLSYRWFYLPPVVFSGLSLFFILERTVCAFDGKEDLNQRQAAPAAAEDI